MNTICPAAALLRLLELPTVAVRPEEEAATICCLDIWRPIVLIERLFVALALPFTVEPRVA